ncbi:type II secretion system protein GspF [Stenotrophomonas sp. Betaine-02u-21]|uniref:type II secretion system inner membrane protein GspF n=1 Tax=unclassified Stenotrophomonas TaxID=196198 RepID=UPI000C32EFB2|nr:MULTISPECIES: type II secretion system inner membrane protein GspF [unclassified Stenotrophomonas]PKH71938.1 type II secretion system protein GspF [Stenotrophomonas sp. Betaine-02u-23]PKH73443.1 type II secretion system protein GspF [Stenotrophomonas sp. Betaine-02u-21]PKH95296.1 type II secretion system protein GspF [Stenotrophomonas sp. Bg11-02]
MPTFDYTALDGEGRIRTGTAAASSVREAREQLERQHLVPVRLEPATQPTQSLRQGRFGTRELAMFTRQLSTLAAGVPLEEALRTIGAQSERRGVRRVVLATHAQVVEGLRLADAMALQGKAFPPLYCAMVAAGERSGSLPDILESLAELLERQQQLRARLIGALVYPITLAATAVVVVIALMAFVVPKVVEQFDSMGRELPLLTRAMIAVSDAMTQWGWLALLLLAVAAIVSARLLRQEAYRLRADTVLLRLPVIGRVIRDMHAARMARTLAVMLASGLPLLEGLSVTARTIGNLALRSATRSMVAALDGGGSLSAAMKQANVFPPTLLYMAGSGESSGRLGPMLERGADYLERELDTFSSATLSLLEPAIIVTLGGVVAMVVLSILLPILQFNSLALG